MPRRLLFVLALVSLAGCREAADAPPTVVATDAPAAPDTSLAPASAILPAERLAALLPARVGADAQVRLVSETDGAMGLTVARAAGTYGAGADSVTVLLMDLGTIEGARLMGLADLATDTLAGRPVRRVETPTETSVKALVGGRYFVEASGRGATADRLDSFLEAVDLGALPGAE